MAIEKDLFSASSFRSTIQSYCNQLEWGISEINDRRAILKFEMESDNTQTLFILRYDSTLEFSCPSGVKFDSTDDVPGFLSTLLLCQNTTYKLGFWCIEDIGERKTFSIMHNAEISLIDVLYFRKVVFHLVSECDKFEEAVETALRNRY